MEERELRELVEYAWDKGYTFSCEHPVMQEYCDSRCVFFKEKNHGVHLKTASDMGKVLREKMATNWEGRRFNLGQFFPVKNLDFSIRTGEMSAIFGDTGTGKTALIMSLITQLKWKTLWFNLEMHTDTVYRRFLQNTFALTKERVGEEYMKRYEEFDSALDYLAIISDPPEAGSIQRIVAAHNPRIVVFDTFDDIWVKGVADPTGRTEIAAREIRAMTDKMDVVTILIHHISKASLIDYRGEKRRLTEHSGKGSSTFEQKCDNIFTLEGTKANPMRLFTSVKGRDEHPFEVHLWFNTDCLFYTAPPDNIQPIVTNGIRLVSQLEA
jgi:GTPase SAR1 family protein